jgi:hypothetical protein
MPSPTIKMLAARLVCLPLLALATPASAQTQPQSPATLPVVAGTRLPHGLVAPPTAALAPDDAMAVHELVTRVYLAEDSRDYDALRAIFTADAVHAHALYGTVVGGPAIAEFVRSSPQGFDGIRHHAYNIVTRSTGANRAEALSYVMPVRLFPQAGQAAGDAPRILGHGVVRDELVKQDGAWRIARRTYDQFSVWPGAVGGDAAILARAARAVER